MSELMVKVRGAENESENMLIIDVLSQNGIDAFYQESADDYKKLTFSSVLTGRDIYVKEDDEKKSKTLIKVFLEEDEVEENDEGEAPESVEQSKSNTKSKKPIIIIGVAVLGTIYIIAMAIMAMGKM